MHVRIYRPAKTAMQSGRAKTQAWILEGIPTTAKQPNSLTGWVSAGDTLQQIRLKFETLEAATAYAAAKGWQAVVQPAHERVLKPKSYAENFL